MTASPVHFELRGLEFDEPSHIYRIHGQIVPSVTQILESSGISDFSNVPEHTLQRAKQRGTAVHKACWFDDQKDLDEDSVTDKISPYLKAWRLFKSESQMEFTMIEEPVWHATHRYAGTFDRLARFPILGDVLMDIKTGEPTPAWPIQTAAYVRALFPGGAPCQRMAVQLRKNGTYKIHMHRMTEFAQHWNVFAGALAVHRYKVANGLI